MDLTKQIRALSKLGEILTNPDPEHFKHVATDLNKLNETVRHVHHNNGWFTESNVSFALKALGRSLNIFDLEKWTKKYSKSLFKPKRINKIGIIMAGNIPLVGFHDYICGLISGHKIKIKLSSNDNVLLPLIHTLLVKIEPDFKDMITFEEGTISDFDAIIATGSNNTSRYFEYYFGKYPHLIRKNRNSVAVLTGEESFDELKGVCEDIFRYFGLGCRNVSKLFVPENYNFNKFFLVAKNFADLINHNKYKNNYDYNKAVYLVNKVTHLDNGFIILKEDEKFSSPVAVVFYEYYQNIDQVSKILITNSEKIQCIVSTDPIIRHKMNVKPGKTQEPALWDYADDIDTLAFLLNLK